MISFLAGEFVSSTIKEINRGLPVYFVGTMEADEFRSHFSLDTLHVKQFLQWVPDSNTTPETLIAKVRRTGVDVRTKP